MNPALRRSAAHVFVASLADPVLEPDDLHHLMRVLRLRDGEAVSVSDGEGNWRLCRLAGGGELVADGEIFVEPGPSPPITIGFAVPKGERPEWIVQKLTEIGVDRIVLLDAAHGVVRWDAERASRNMVRLNKIAREAAMQSRRVRLVELLGPVTVEEIVTGAGAGGNAQVSMPAGVALAEPGGASIDLARPTILIGPEGGWTADEVSRADATVSLGATILRVETAAIVAAAQLVMQRDAGS